MSSLKNKKENFKDLEVVYSDCDDKESELISNDNVEKDNTDDDLYVFYYKVLRYLLDAKNKKNVDYFRLYCKLLRQSSNSWCILNKDASSDLKKSLFYLISQLYRNGPIVSSAVAHFFDKSADLDSNILKGLLDKSEINICSFGGFPADILGIVYKLYFASAEKGCDLKINLTVLDDDINNEWENVCKMTLMYFNPFRTSFVKLAYFHFHPKASFDDIYRSADIISMVKFFSKSFKTRSYAKSLLQDVCKHSKSGCIIFVLDSPLESLVEQCGGYSGKRLHKYSIPICDDVFGLHTLEQSVLKNNSGRFKYLCDGVLPNYSMKYFVRIWVKSHFTLPSMKELDLESIQHDLEMWFEMNKHNPALKSYHLEIEKLKSELENMKEKTQRLTDRRDFLKLMYDHPYEIFQKKERFICVKIEAQESLLKEEQILSEKLEARKKFDLEAGNKTSKQARKLFRLINQNMSIRHNTDRLMYKQIHLFENQKKNMKYAEQEYKVAEEELNMQKQKQEAAQFCFESNKEELHKLAWKTYLENKRSFVLEELQNYRCSITRPFK